MPHDERTLAELVKIGNTIDPDIQLEYEVPSMHEGGKMPILDLQVWVEDNTLRHMFYKKDIATRYLIHERTALSMKTKREALLQEGLRRIRNTDKLVEQEAMKNILGNFFNDMRLSGYGWKIRSDLAKGIMERARQIEEEIAKGERVRYRNREQITKSKGQKLGKHPGTWHIRGEFTATMKVQATKGGELARRTQEVLKGHRGGDGGLTKDR